MSEINLEELERKLDFALNRETPESLKEWLEEKRHAVGNVLSDETDARLVIEHIIREEQKHVLLALDWCKDVYPKDNINYQLLRLIVNTKVATLENLLKTIENAFPNE